MLASSVGNWQAGLNYCVMTLRCLFLFGSLVASSLFAADSQSWPLPALKPDPSLKAAIEKALDPASSDIHLSRDTRDKTLVQVFMQIDRPPADMAFDVSLQGGNLSWRVGPVAWKKGDAQWWAYDVDLPENLTHVNVVFTPNARAGMMMSRFPTFPINGLAAIWSGSTTVTSEIKIRDQVITMIKLKPPIEGEMREHLFDALPSDSNSVQQLAGGATIDDMRKSLEEQIAKPNAKPEKLYELGCMLIAQGQLEEAMKFLVKTRDTPELAGSTQRELRYICARWLDAADNGSLPEMYALGRAYEQGHGVGMDKQKAAYWFRKAANAGHVEALKRWTALREPPQPVDDSAKKALESYRTQALDWHRQSVISYQDWVSAHLRKSFKARDFSGETANLKAVITTYNNEGDEYQESSHGFELMMDGHLQSFAITPRGIKGGGSTDPLPAEQLARIDHLLAKLPDDRRLLPPPERRIMVEIVASPQHRVHVFDLANAPSELHELMRSLGASSAYVPHFQPSGFIAVRGFDHGGALAVSHQGEILFTSPQRLQWWNATTHEFIAEAHVPYVHEIVIAPDKTHALVQSSSDTVLIDLPSRKILRTFPKRFASRFTQSGDRVLLFSATEPVETLSTGTWEPTSFPDYLPDGLTQFIPAPTIQRAIVRGKDGSTSLWDTAMHRPVKLLSPKSDLHMLAVFSPDESMIGLCLRPHQSFSDKDAPFVIIKSDTGMQVNELRPFESNPNGERSASLLWSSNGEYLFAASGRGVSVFNASTGRHRGQLTGPTRINGLGFLPQSDELVAGDEHGKIWFWRLPDVLHYVREFEASLAPTDKKSSP